jgi:carboxypeptidase Taq
MNAYVRLEERFRRFALVREAEAILQWDWSTMMPPGAAEERAEQITELKTIQHGILADPEVTDLLDAADSADGLDDWQRANLREMRRTWIHRAAIGADLVAARAKAEMTCETAWRRAREEDDFAAVRPFLEEVLSLVREVAAVKAEKLGCTPYDALIDQYEPGFTTADIDAAFGDLPEFLPVFLQQVLEKQAAETLVTWPDGPFPVAKQRALGRRLMGSLGFDFKRGRLDTSLHPFSGGAPDDHRITTRYNKDDFTESLMGVLHETGHALYEDGLPREWRHQPVGEARGMGIHESQSLLVEMQVCRSRAFIGFAAPMIREAFGGEGPAWEADNLYRIYKEVHPGLIRVDADEVTYSLHIFLRYELERALISGGLAVADLPDAWSEGMRRWLGVTPPDDRDGCLQDIHWYDGALGYFPSYTIGAMAAAQFFDAAERDDADIVPGIARGDFKPLFGWLRANVHSRGSALTTGELIEAATGAALCDKAYKRHLHVRYLA